MRDPFDAPLRDGSAYRADRLEVERKRLQRRLLWAADRGDQRAVDWLEKRLDEIEREMGVDLRPGCPPNRFDRDRQG